MTTFVQPVVTLAPSAPLSLVVQADNPGQLYITTGGSAGAVTSVNGLTGAVSVGPLLVSQFAPAVRERAVLSSATMAPFDGTNMHTGPFVAPASGKVVVRVHAALELVSASAGFALAAHGTLTPLVSNVIVLQSPSDIVFQYADLAFLVSGLTPGNSYDLDLMGCSNGSVAVCAQGQSGTTPNLTNPGGPVVMTVSAV